MYIRDLPGVVLKFVKIWYQHTTYSWRDTSCSSV